MKIFVDGDASPVVEETIKIATEYHLQVVVIRSYDHFSSQTFPDNVTTIHVDKGNDSADFAIISRVTFNDIVITQDYGLASICLGKGAHVIHHKGFLYTNENIDQLLSNRHASAKARRAGYRTKGPKPFTKNDREKFINLLKITINKQL